MAHQCHHWPEAWPNLSSDDEVHTFDPVGNLLLVLKRTPLAEASIPGEPQPAPAEPQELANTEDLISGATSSSEPPFEQAREDIATEAISQQGLENQGSLDGTQNVYLRVSAGHLVLASSVFKTLLEPDEFKEGNLPRSQGNMIVPLPDDPEALIILMHAIHGKTRKVPRTVALNTLVRLATLVDLYRLHEAVELFSDTWVKNLKEKVFPKNYNPDVVPWLFISWVFQIEDAFIETTQLLICEGDDKAMAAIKHENVPIPSKLCHTIQERRNEAVGGIVKVIHDYIAKYLTSDIICTKGGFTCDANVLGSLLKSSAIIGLWPRPTVPYHGITFNGLATHIREMQIVDNCGTHYGYGSHETKDTINVLLRSMEDQYCGLRLDFMLVTQIWPEVKKGTKGKKKKGRPVEAWAC